MSSIPIIQLKNLSKHFKSVHAVQDLNLEVFQGECIWFSRTKWCRKEHNNSNDAVTDSGLMQVRYPSSEKNFMNIEMKFLKRSMLLLRALISICIYQRKKILTVRKLYGSTSTKKKIHELMELVGLKGREKDKVKTYSHGMKQRLGLAQTLIHDPELIILTNLQPVWIRRESSMCAI